MARPKGSLNKPKTSVTIDSGAVITSDGYAEAFTGAGTNRDRSTFTRAKSVHILGSNELMDMYLSDGYARKIVDVVAEEMTRAGIEIEDIEDQNLVKNIESQMQALDYMRHMNDAVRWSRLFGGALLVYGVNDGGALDTMLNFEGIKDVEFLRVYDRSQVTVQSRVTDVMLASYGDVETWMISPNSGGSPYLVHNSRCHVFDGESVPDLLRYSNQGWGVSALQACYDQLVRLGMSHQWVNMLLERSQQAVHKIPDMADILRSPGGEASIQKRVDLVDMVRGILNTIVVDGQEDYTVTSQSMTGVSDVIDRFAESLSAVSNIPVMLLLGRSAGGLSGSGKGELDTWYARITSMQNDILMRPIDKLVMYLLKAMSADIEYCIKFNSLVIKSDLDIANIKKIEAESDKIRADTAMAYVGIAALDAEEVRAGLSSDYELNDSVAKQSYNDQTLDSVDLAMSHLHVVKQVVENNYPINIAEGNLEQAILENQVNQSVIEALVVLENYLKASAK